MSLRRVYFLSMSGIENHVDWTAAATPRGGRAGPARGARPAGPATRRDVMDTLLGEHKLAAFDVSGSDPYNTTGKQFRR